MEHIRVFIENALPVNTRAYLEWPGPPGSHEAYREEDLDNWCRRPPDHYVYPAFYEDNVVDVDY